MAKITIYLDDELIQQVKQSAAEAKVSQGQWIADLIRQYCARLTKNPAQTYCWR